MDDAEAAAVVDGVWRLDLGRVNAYLVDDGGPVLVDAGTPWDAGEIAVGVAGAGYEVADVDRVLLTHYDLDHVGALSRLAPELAGPVYAADPDAAWLAGESRPPLADRKGFLQRLTGIFFDRPDLSVERLADGDTVGSFTAYRTPGHTPGHLAFVSERRSAAMLGDLVRESGGDLSPSPWFVGANAAQVRDSIDDLAARAPDFEAACVGHGDPIGAGGGDALRRLAADRE